MAPPSALALQALRNDMRIDSEDEADARGSNNWVVAGSRTRDGRAILADDMHLGLSVPNIWYRASLTRPHLGRDLTVTGVTLPGVPSMIAGSNGSIAWGFTNTTADWTDRVQLFVEGDGETVIRARESRLDGLSHSFANAFASAATRPASLVGGAPAGQDDEGDGPYRRDSPDWA